MFRKSTKQQRSLQEKMKADDLDLQDDKSVYSVDPLMYQKLGLRKPNKGEEQNGLDAQKVLLFQLEKDLPKVVARHGSFEHLSREYYLGDRVKPASYLQFNTQITESGKLKLIDTLGKNGQVKTVAEYASDVSWRETTKPFGIIAKKRYAEYLAGLPKGPTDAEIRAVKQKEADEKLWQLIKNGQDPDYIDGIKVRKKNQFKDEIDEQEAKLAAAHADEQRALKEAEDAERLHNFAYGRKLSTQNEHIKSINGWHKGIHYPFSFDRGFPHGPGDVNTRPRDTTIPLDIPFKRYDTDKYSSKEYIQGDGTGDLHCAFLEYFNKVCFDRAVVHLEEVRLRKIEAEKQRKREERRALRLSMKGGMFGAQLPFASGAVVSPSGDIPQVGPGEEQAEPKADVGNDAGDPRVPPLAVKGIAENTGDEVRVINGAALEDASQSAHTGEADEGKAVASRTGSASVSGSGSGGGGRRKSTVSFSNSISLKDEKEQISTELLDEQSFDLAEPSMGNISNITGLGKDDITVPDEADEEEIEKVDSAAHAKVLSVLKPPSENQAYTAVPAEDQTPMASSVKKKPLKKRIRKMLKQAGKTSGHYIRGFFRIIRRGIRTGYRLIRDHGPSTIATAYRVTTGAIGTTYVFVRDNTVGPPIKPKKQYPKTGKHWNHIPKPDKRINPIPPPGGSRKSSLKSMKSNLGSEEELAEGGSMKRRKSMDTGRRGSLQSGRRSSVDGNTADDGSVGTYENSDDSSSDDDAPADQSKKQRGMKRKNHRKKTGCLRSIFNTVYEIVMGRPPPKESLLEKRARERETKSKVELTEAKANQAAMDLIFRQRAVKRKSEQFYQKWFGVASPEDRIQREYSVQELMEATRRAKYDRILDILDNGFDSVGPNDTNDDGESAFYNALLMVLRGEQNESGEEEMNEDLSLWERIKLRFSRKARLMQLELIVNIFLFKGGDVNFIRDDRATDGRAIMHYAAEQGSTEMISWLVSKKADVNIRTTVDKTTPLMLACGGGHIDAMMLLLKHGAVAHVNDVDNRGMTALHFAAIGAQPEHAEVLLICGANKLLRSNDNRLPVEEATARGRAEMQIRIQQYKPPRTLREEKMTYLEKIYGFIPDDETGTVADTTTVPSHDHSVATSAM